MVKLFRIPGTDVKIRLSQGSSLFVNLMFDHDQSTALAPGLSGDAAMIQALGFPTKAPKPQPIDGGDLEEVAE